MHDFGGLAIACRTHTVQIMHIYKSMYSCMQWLACVAICIKREPTLENLNIYVHADTDSLKWLLSGHRQIENCFINISEGRQLKIPLHLGTAKL